uniref:C2H2-type domain-containing protein n=1 Tax=Rhabditophanes sp. KR3021 TaxID=114890 RepID=A0AC35UBI4_9BILA
MRESKDSENWKIGEQPEMNNNTLTSPDSFLLSLAASAAAQNPIFQPDLLTNNRDSRKRRRIVGNMDNTLDGLVARRAEVDPSAKLYQTETEAIELPDDDEETRRVETDPDVSTRMCSLCGYQGKWVSEMIRHKRVHTNERPFKCKYCNRTSKWKADLIRHVAKTHGIRVVSKYSRSKAFEVTRDGKGGSSPQISPNSSSSSCVSPTEFEEQLHITSTNDSIKGTKSFEKEGESGVSKAETTLATFKCTTCLYEQESFEAMTSHLEKVHGLPPFECTNCLKSFLQIGEAAEHCSLPHSICTATSIKINFTPLYTNNTKQQQHRTLLPDMSTLTSPTSLMSQSLSPSSTISSARSYDMLPISMGSGEMKCNNCPFKTASSEKMVSHQVGHETPKGPFNYKCIFCSWYAKKRSSVENHMLLHTPNPSNFMSEVEKNLITSASGEDIHRMNEATLIAASSIPNSLPIDSFCQQIANLQKSLQINPMISMLSALAATNSPQSSLLNNAQMSPATLLAPTNALSQPQNAFSSFNPMDQSSPSSALLAFHLYNMMFKKM